MKKLLVLLLMLLPTTSWAASPSKAEMINELIQVMKMDAMVESTYDQMEGMMTGLAGQLGVTPEEQPIFDKYYRKMTGVLKQEMSWDKMSPMMVGIYQKHFSETEIREMLAFYKTETGQSIINKLPMVTQEAMLLSQQMVQGALPKMQAVAVELERELAEARQAHN